MTSSGPENRLARESSPYLRQHATNPVDWYPWGDEALRKAREEQRPILLSIGYSACHWCHVMAHESFEDAKTAAVMNQHFVNIKLDREERPDVDQLYQGVVQLMGRGGGWPLTVFLTPDLRPFYGGTYFPPTPRHGLPAFSSLVGSLAEAWVREPEEIERQAAAFKDGLTQLAAYGLDGAGGESLVPGDVVDAARQLAHAVDPRYGGFGSRGPKFPNPMNVAMLLRGYRRTKDRALLDAGLLCLTRMAEGGVYDQLGGGFHRYSVDEKWAVPHFEKMLYDNAQLLHLYSEAMQLEPRPLWRKVVEETVAYVAREMTSPEGAFFAAQDADTEGEEGKTFVWTPAEVSEVVGADGPLLCAHLGVTAEGNFEHGKTVLFLAASAEALAKQQGLAVGEVEQRLAKGKAALLAAREKRAQPGRDDKVLAGWNGLMMRGLALAARAFGRPEWAAMAARAADVVLAKLRRDDGRLLRSLQDGAGKLDGVAEDYGDVAVGLLAVYQATQRGAYLDAAEQLVDKAVELLWDEGFATANVADPTAASSGRPDEQRSPTPSTGKSAWLAAPKGQSDLLVPTYALHDNAFPSGASTLTDAQVTLAALTGHQRHFDHAGKYLARLRGELKENPFAFGHLLLAADAWLDGAAEVTVVGAAAATAPFMVLLDGRYLPTLAVHRVEPGAPTAASAAEVLGSRPAKGEAAAYLCHHLSCRPPVTTASALTVLLDELSSQGS